MHRSFGAAVFGLFIASAATTADAGVLIAPTRLVLEGSVRNGEFILVNKGRSSARYRLSMVNRRMDDDGRVVEASEPRPDERFAEAMLRFSPRTVVLPPNEPQTVRVLARRSGDLEPGEYRSHLLIQQAPDAPPAAPDPGADPDGISIRIEPIFGLTVPIIVRHGETHAEGSLRDLALSREEGQARLRLSIHRTGNRSLYGNLVVYHETRDGTRSPVGRANGVAIYTPNADRPLELSLDLPNGSIPGSGRLVVEYRDAEDPTSRLIAEAALGLARH